MWKITQKVVAVPNCLVSECHSSLIQFQKLPETFPLQNAAVTFHFVARQFFFLSPPFPTHQGGGGKPSINEQIGIVIRLAVQGDGPFGNRRKSCLINGDINHGLARLAKRRSISCLIYRQDMRERGEVMAELERRNQREILIESSKFVPLLLHACVFFFFSSKRRCCKGEILHKSTHI